MYTYTEIAYLTCEIKQKLYIGLILVRINDSERNVKDY